MVCYLSCRISTDMQLGTNCGFQKLLVLSGASKLEDVKEDSTNVPHFYAKTLGDLLPLLPAVPVWYTVTLSLVYKDGIQSWLSVFSHAGNILKCSLAKSPGICETYSIFHFSVHVHMIIFSMLILRLGTKFPLIWGLFGCVSSSWNKVKCQLDATR